MVSKVIKTGNSLVVLLPSEVIERLNLREGSELEVQVDGDASQILLMPARPETAEIDAKFARQLDEFIERYRPALAALAR